MKKTFKKSFALYAMLVPSFAVLIVFAYIPLAGLSIAFQDFIPAFGFLSSKQEWIGFENFQYAVTLPNFWQTVYNTLFIAIGKIVLGTIGAISLSLLLNEVPQNVYRKSVQTIIYLPHFISWVILAGILQEVLALESGIVNQALRGLGIKEVYFLGDEKVFPWVMIVSDWWKELGFSTIVYLAAISTINPELYEAGKIDGASRLRLMWHVTLPGMRSIIALNLLLSVGNIFNAGFDQIYNLYSDQVLKTGDVLDTLIYRLGLEQRSYGVSTAVSLMKSGVTGLFMATFYYISYKLLDYKIF